MIEIAPLAFMRGRTLANACIILDEAQNTTSMQMKMFLTRLGENVRMIITGDPSQIDLPRGVKSGLVEALEILKGVDGVSVVTFKDVDVVRHPLVATHCSCLRCAVHDTDRHRTFGPLSAQKMPTPILRSSCLSKTETGLTNRCFRFE